MEGNCVKISDLLERSRINNNCFSLEVSPGLDLGELADIKKEPLFYSVTWHAKMHMCRDLEIPCMQLAEELSTRGLTVLLHVSCDHLRTTYLDELLKKIKEINIRNIFAVRGDKFDRTTSDFEFAKDLVNYIRVATGNYFSIGVAGYPDCDDTKLQHLKNKIDCGADFIITQASFCAQDYINFENRCRSIGVKVPIVPGIFLFESVNQLKGFAKLCDIRITGELSQYVNSDVEFISRDVVKSIVEELKAVNNISCHFFSLNRVQHVLDFINCIK